ncbi:50S ribosomal protein L25/general stress protein Ctc [Oerskovia turbata]|uniref:Large ribosomal subunit protein bL25 n=1 Tax=Oerskovia turbata TaxID=1713 RepID=A0A4Q1KWD6_9CELL|nr:50S ribosomal protein L25/general stress protein Ctc [Oerskovia turbata]RXR26850.1 50S ribosomal protein L25/general stress protein Ctc [Oerskovia turbata]RXR34583.1 50S ribosomal protein L25/general stress protein Ctc [Oerskovia turbata]TGJ97855.1 50S ribosomal protein L25 [Actinotalea fermentans ATCC 43279 = JCM 9966 = DSM 3133]
MSETKLVAEARTEFGKGAARRIRRASQIPAVLYGHGTDPVHIALPGHVTTLALKQANALFSIELDGKPVLAIAKDVQRDPVKDVVEHIDLLIVKKGEKVEVEVNVHVVGESAPGTIHVVESQTLLLEAEATHLPESVEVSIEGLEAGHIVRAGEITLPKGAAFHGDAELAVVAITEPRSEVAAEAEAAEAAEEAPAEA